MTFPTGTLPPVDKPLILPLLLNPFKEVEPLLSDIESPPTFLVVPVPTKALRFNLSSSSFSSRHLLTFNRFGILSVATGWNESTANSGVYLNERYLIQFCVRRSVDGERDK